MPPTRNKLRYLSHSRARLQLDAADLLLFRPRPLRWCEWLWPRNWFGALVCLFGRTPYCHAAKAVACRGVWLAVETIEGQGGRAYPLERYASELSGAVDVYRPDADRRHRFDHQGSAAKSLELLGKPYGYRALLLSALMHLPLVRQVTWSRLKHRLLDDNAPHDGPLYCSGAAAWADRTGGGVDPVMGLSDAFTEPGDLARSPLYTYLFTLVSDDDPRAEESPS